MSAMRVFPEEERMGQERKKIGYCIYPVINMIQSFGEYSQISLTSQLKGWYYYVNFVDVKSETQNLNCLPKRKQLIELERWLSTQQPWLLLQRTWV